MSLLAGPTSTPESLLAAIVDSSDDAIASKDLNGVITSWNRSAERLFGYRADEIVGKSVLTLIPPERQDEEPRILARLRKGERVDHFDTQRRRKDGTLIDVSLTISPVKNAHGEVVGASKIARDISERKRLEAASQAYKSKLEIVNKVATQLTAELDLQRLVQLVTDAGRELSGAAFGAFFYNTKTPEGEAYMLYTLSGAPRDAFERFGHPRATPIFKPTFEGTGVVRLDDVMADPRYGQMAPHHGMPKGHLPVRSYLAAPIISRDGGVIGGLFFGHPEIGIFTEESEMLLLALANQAAVAIDNARLYEKLELELAQQRLTEEKLRESQELSSSILNSTADCVAVLDAEGRLLAMNPPGARAMEIEDVAAINGSPWVDLWPEEMRPKVETAIRRAMEGESGRFEGLCPTRAGAIKWWDVIVSPLRDAEGRVTRLTSTSRDITERRRNLEQLEAAHEEAERQGRMKDEFLATLSHELRTPLQAILGWTQILRDANSGREQVAHGVEVIDRNARSQTRIIEDLLDMSRILSGQIRLDVQRLALSPIITAAIETVQPAADAKEIRLQTILDPLAQPVSGDPNRLQQIFWNLLSNAIKFTHKGGRVQVLLERVNSHLEISVSDNGAGISPEFLPHVFERFRQADASRTRRSGGLGLGLAIVKHLVELHGGSVRAKSGGEGAGATFTVVLPLAPLHPDATSSRRHPAGEGPVSAPTPLPSLAGISVLVVDDEADALELLTVVLTKAGAKVRSANSAAQAMELLRQEVPTVLVSDIGMPEEDGLSLISRIRATPEVSIRKVPAVALSAYTRTEDRIQSISAGFQVHLAKPADSLELLTVIRSIAHTA